MPLMEHFHNCISHHFFDAATETFDLAKQTALFESLGVLEKDKNKITKSFIKLYENKIKQYSPENILNKVDAEEEKELSLESLALVEAEDLITG